MPSFIVEQFFTCRLSVYSCLVPLLLHKNSSLLAYVAALLVASVSKASKARSADARSCDSNLVVILNPQQQKKPYFKRPF